MCGETAKSNIFGIYWCACDAKLNALSFSAIFLLFYHTLWQCSTAIASNLRSNFFLALMSIVRWCAPSRKQIHHDLLLVLYRPLA